MASARFECLISPPALPKPLSELYVLPSFAVPTSLDDVRECFRLLGDIEAHCARNPALLRAADLHALATAHPDRVYILKIVSADRANNAAAVEEVKRVAGRLDVVIANAGMSDCFKPALEVPPEEIVRHVEVR